MRKPKRGGVLNLPGHVGAIMLLYLAFSGAMYLGLQVAPVYGNIGLGVFAVLVGAYVYFGFIRRR